MDYVIRQAELHEFADYADEAALLEKATRGEEVDLDKIGGSGRRQAVRTVLDRIGQGNFRSRILAVYGHKCAVCEVQLDLVQAAHIVPVPVGGDNATPNGIALCYLHHAAYDRALIGITPAYEVKVNDAALKRLGNLRWTGGWPGFRENLRENVLLPRRPQDYPDRDRLQEGLRLRGWG